MSDYLPDSGVVTRPYCPACEPDTDPLDLVSPQWCYTHAPSTDGPDDALTGSPRGLSSSGEADGADCAAVARMIR